MVLGAGSVAFGIWAIARPERFARFMGSNPAMGRYTGLRDLLIGAAMLVRPGPATFLARAAADSWDAGTVSRSKVSRGAAAFGGWALLGALASAWGRGRQSSDAPRLSPSSRTREVYP